MYQCIYDELFGGGGTGKLLFEDMNQNETDTRTFRGSTQI